MKKLTKVRLINWHYLSNETIEIKNNVLLTGPNATGKSTILDAISFVITAGDTAFNMAANDKGKRDLRGYVKCKLGTDEREYLRDGDVSGHIALEFYDETQDSYMNVGVVIDAFGELMPVKVLFYEAQDKIKDSTFVSPEGVIYGTVDFRKVNSDFEYFLTKKEAKRGFRTAFGSVNEDFFRLIPKALAFKPIADVKDFIYQNILEEKQIDVSSIKDAIRSYKELENTLNVIKTKINDLHEMQDVYNDMTKIEASKNYYTYLMKLFDQEKIVENAKNANRQIEALEAKKVVKQQDIKRIDMEIDGLQERSKDLYMVLSNNSEFKADEYIDKQIIKCRQNIAELQEKEESFIKKASYTKEIINNIRHISKNKLYNEMANLPIAKIEDTQVERTKLDLINFEGKITDNIASANQELGRLLLEKDGIIKEVNDIRSSLAGLEQHKLRYPPALIQIRSEIAAGLKRLYGYDVSVHIFAELIEITDKKWADTVEIYLGNRRFDLIIEPRYYDAALQIFARIKNNYRMYGVGLVNTKRINTFSNHDEGSLASIITSDNVDAMRYVNMTCGNLIMCDNEMELEKYNRSITNDGLIYQQFTVRSLNPNIEKPFIGKNALGEQTDLWNSKALEAKQKYLDISERITALQQELGYLTKLDLKSLIKDLDATLQLSKEKASLADLTSQKNRKKDMSVGEIQDDYNKVLQTIKNYDAKKIIISQEIGAINNAINNFNEQIAQSSSLIEESKKELAMLTNSNLEIENQARHEYEDVKNSGNIQRALADYQKRLEEEENNYQVLCDGLVAKQFKYINAYNSTYTIGVSEMPKFLGELNKLEKSELIQYEQKVRTAREGAEIVFKEDFLSKLRNNIMTAESEIEKINETLHGITFGNDTYEFIFPKSKEYQAFYDMVTSDIDDSNSTMFTYDFQSKYQQQLEELFNNLSQDELNSNGAISKFTDYRTYMDYDIKILNSNGTSMSYSKVFKEKSGGETQVPFYVAIIASFVRIYSKTKMLSGDTIGLVLFDEVFDKMDSNRMRGMMSFITSMPLQVIIACPPQRMSLLGEFTDTTLVMVRKDTRAQVLPFLKNEEEIDDTQDLNDDQEEE